MQVREADSRDSRIFILTFLAGLDWWKIFFWMVHEAGYLRSVSKRAASFAYTAYEVTATGTAALSAKAIMLVPTKALVDYEQKKAASAAALRGGGSAAVSSAAVTAPPQLDKESVTRAVKDTLQTWRLNVANSRQLLNPCALSATLARLSSHPNVVSNAVHIIDDVTLDGIAQYVSHPWAPAPLSHGP